MFQVAGSCSVNCGIWLAQTFVAYRWDKVSHTALGSEFLGASRLMDLISPCTANASCNHELVGYSKSTYTLNLDI